MQGMAVSSASKDSPYTEELPMPSWKRWNPGNTNADGMALARSPCTMGVEHTVPSAAAAAPPGTLASAAWRACWLPNKQLPQAMLRARRTQSPPPPRS